jgi:hypothetical protein
MQSTRLATRTSWVVLSTFARTVSPNHALLVDLPEGTLGVLVEVASEATVAPPVVLLAVVEDNSMCLTFVAPTRII